MQWRTVALVALLCLPAAATAPPGPVVRRVTFTESFPGSQPVFFQITVHPRGAVEYRTIEASGQPSLRLRFAAPRLAARIFALTRQLHDFRFPRLESRKRVGDMGAKMLAYDDAAHHSQQTFNFTTIRAAAQLNRIFQNISSASEDALRLDREIRYDPLGVVQALNDIGRAWTQHQIAPQPLLPVLRRAAADPNLMNIAQRRAALLIRMMTPASARRHGGG